MDGFKSNQNSTISATWLFNQTMLDKSLGYHLSKFDLESCARKAAMNGGETSSSQLYVRTYAFVALWLVGSCRTASSFSSSSLLRREPGTDLEGILSSIT